MPVNPGPTDSNNGISDEYTRLALNLGYLQKSRAYSTLSTETVLPRLMWVKKSWTLQELHLEIFKYLR